MPEHQEIAQALMKRFPGWKTWHGPHTKDWWAMAPTEVGLTRLLRAPTPDELAVHIAQHVEPKHLTADQATGMPIGPRLCRRLDEDPYPVRLARRTLDDALDAWSALCWQDDGRIIISEMVTNAEMHGKPPIFLTLGLRRIGTPALLIEVTDASAKRPEEKEPGHNGGFGLDILKSLAEVTVHIHPGGKTVRAVLKAADPRSR
jgi:hypothetical protein